MTTLLDTFSNDLSKRVKNRIIFGIKSYSYARKWETKCYHIIKKAVAGESGAKGSVLGLVLSPIFFINDLDDGTPMHA